MIPPQKRIDSKPVSVYLIPKARVEQVIPTRSMTIILKTGDHAHTPPRASRWGRSLSEPPSVHSRAPLRRYGRTFAALGAKIHRVTAAKGEEATTGP